MILVSFISISAVFAYSYIASDVGYTPVDTSWDVDNVSEAIDDLRGMSKCTNELINKTWVFGYTGQESIFVSPCKGTYKIEAWGGQGATAGSYIGGYGGYSVGLTVLGTSDILYVVVGGAGSASSNGYAAGGYNGGGKGFGSYGSQCCSSCGTRIAGGGGGATHIAVSNRGVLSNYESYLNEIIMVAGGGGAGYENGNSSYGHGGASGGYIGGNGVISYSSYSIRKDSTGGTQTSGGVSGYTYAVYTETASFGQGGGVITGSACGETSGGGGGLYGGGLGRYIPAAGGSSYLSITRLNSNTSGNITKSMYCYKCTESDDLNTYTTATYGTTTHASLKDTTNCPNGYSSSAISKCAKAGNGFAKITYLG